MNLTLIRRKLGLFRHSDSMAGYLLRGAFETQR